MFGCEASNKHTHTHTDVCFSELTQVMRWRTYFDLQQSFLSLVEKLHILLADLGEEGLVLVLLAQSFSKQQAVLCPLSGRSLRTQQVFTHVYMCMCEKSLCF